MLTSQHRPRLGIMTCHLFSEEGFFRFLAQAGQKMGMEVIVFQPQSYSSKEGKIYGIHWRGGKWRKGWFEKPHLIYDRCFYPNSRVYQQLQPFLQNLKKDPFIHFLGFGLHGKLQIVQLLSKHEQLAHFLPPTEAFTSTALLRKWLDRFQTIILKPTGGSLGKRILRIQQLKKQYFVAGRNRSNQYFQQRFQQESSLLAWLKQFMGGSSYVIQPYLSLQTKDEIPFDCRLLVQKNGHGKWQLTGQAIRLGKQGQITSNLHGGGTAMPVQHFLKKYYKPEQQDAIQRQINIILQHLPHYLEEQHGRLVELGIDIGIEPSGRVWIIEANSKPGRRVFSIIGDKQTSEAAHLQPIYYAKYLLTSNKEVVN
ncbi:YheC/YheD family endospore coat-associated protein [Rubeoparvulum massiliense]|uniref:YheC/YheD family endospore coat-associated protein n=1 Tax=Rubeoparvulum massiliense TaxID=1631346 RepID=UPI00065E3015|nr:YheC/YheD family protein [Rubeoparvulum massiliense]